MRKGEGEREDKKERERDRDREVDGGLGGGDDIWVCLVALSPPTPRGNDPRWIIRTVCSLPGSSSSSRRPEWAAGGSVGALRSAAAEFNLQPGGCGFDP